jgi:ribosomal protein S18 acetylase RimI-like enzyme
MEHMKVARKTRSKDYYSNRRLVPAISLYKKFGFEEVPLDDAFTKERY